MEQETPFDGKPKSAKGLLDAIEQAERSYQSWQRVCDRIDKLYSNLTGFSDRSITEFSDREFSLFWATIEVIKPSIYSRPPVPAVETKFKDRDPIKRTAAEMLERCAISGFDLSDIDQAMLDVRDDLAIVGRGVLWVTYENEDDETERVCIEHLDREDFVHEPARKWAEVGWVARRAWLSKREMRKRFYKTSGAAYQEAEYSVRKDDQRNGGADKSLKCGVWEIWSKTEKKVFWVTKGVDVRLDEGEPHLKLSRFFPCPRPAYGSLQRRSLIPVPDVTYYEDQLEQINELTARIHGLVDSLRVKGLYPAGGDVGDAVEMALKMDDDAKVLVPVNAAVLGQVAMKDMIVWLPIDQIAATIQACVLTRTQLIEDVYQIVGTADIMRGATDPNETAKAQTLKAQFGAVRIRDKVAELVRVARDTVRIMAEIMAEEFSQDTLVDMAQMDIPSDADVKKRVAEIRADAEKELEALTEKAEAMLQSPEAQQMAAQDPAAAEAQFKQSQQQIIAKYKGLIEKAASEPTIEQIMELIEDQKTRPFVFDIETDSTIYPDEQSEKQSRNEYMTAFTAAATALAPLAMQGGASAQLAGELMKFQLGAYRAGRQLEGAIDEWIKQMESGLPNGEGDDTKALAEAQNKLAEAEMEKARAQMAKVEADSTLRQADMQRKMFELQQKSADAERKSQIEIGSLQGKLGEQEARINLMQAQTAEILSRIGLDARKQDLEEYEAAEEAQARKVDQALSVQDRQRQAVESDRSAQMSERQQSFSERQAEQGE